MLDPGVPTWQIKMTQDACIQSSLGKRCHQTLWGESYMCGMEKLYPKIDTDLLYGHGQKNLAFPLSTVFGGWTRENSKNPAHIQAHHSHEVWEILDFFFQTFFLDFWAPVTLWLLTLGDKNKQFVKKLLIMNKKSEYIKYNSKSQSQTFGKEACYTDDLLRCPVKIKYKRRCKINNMHNNCELCIAWADQWKSEHRGGSDMW